MVYFSIQSTHGERPVRASGRNAPLIRVLILALYMLLPSVLRHCWLGGRKGIRPVKKLSGGLLVWLSLEQGEDLLIAQLMPLPLTVSCFSKIQIDFTFSVPAHLGSPRKGPLNGCVCIYVCLLVS